MRDLPNIDKTVRHGIYLGYANGDVYQIRKEGKFWSGLCFMNGTKHVYGKTLAEVSAKLNALVGK